MEELLGCTNIDVGGGFAGVCGSVFSGIGLAFVGQVERGILTRGCLGGGGSPTRSSSLGETDCDDRVTTDDSCALVLSSCSSSASRLGEMTRERIWRLLVTVKGIKMTDTVKGCQI